MNLTIGILLIINAFFFGSIPWGLILGKINGIDIRNHGSKNIGATNVMRTIGIKMAILVFFLDFLKGFIFPFLFQVQVIPIVFAIPISKDIYLAPALCGLMSIVGHCFSIFLLGKGGKGVSTGLGIVAGFSPVAGITCLVVFILVVFLTKYVSLGSIIGALTSVLVSGFEDFYWTHPVFISSWRTLSTYVHFTVVSLAVLIIIIKHHANIKRLFLKTEPKIK